MAASDASVKQLQLQISASTELLIRNLKQADATVAQFRRDTDRQLDQIDGRFYELGHSIGSNLRSAIGSAAGLLGGVSLIALAREGLDYASSLGEVADALGVGTDFLQKFRYAASQTGGSIEGADNAIGKFAVTVGKARDGNKAAESSFANLNVALADADGKARPLEAVYQDVARAIAKIPDPARQAAAAQAIFGKGFRDIMPLLKEGADGFRQLATDAQTLGLVLDRELIDKADAAADRLAALKNVMAVKIAGVVAENADAILVLANALATLATNAGDAIIATRNFFALRSFDGGKNWAAAQDLMQSSSGRQALLNELSEKLQQNSKDRANARGGRKKLLGGIVEITASATPEQLDKLDREFEQLNRQRNAVLQLERAETTRASRPAPLTKPSIQSPIKASAARIGRGATAKAGPTLADRLKAEAEGSGAFLSAELTAAGADANALAVDLGSVDRALAQIRTGVEGVDIGKILSEDEQRRLEDFTEGFHRDLSDGLANAIVFGGDLGDVLINSIKRASAELLSSSILELLRGGSGGGILSSFGRSLGRGWR